MWIIVFLSVLWLTLVLLILACGLIQYKLMAKNSISVTPWPQQGVVNRNSDLGLAPIPPSHHMASASAGPSTLSVKKETESLVIQTRQVETNVLLTHHAQPNTPQLLPPQPMVAPMLTLSNALPRKQIASQVSLRCIYKTPSLEDLHSDNSGSIHSVEYFSPLDRSSQSTSPESLDSNGSESEEEEENVNSTILFPIRPM